MNRYRTLAAVLTLVCGLFLTVGAVQADPFSNGSFEQGIDIPGDRVPLGMGSTDITNWVVSSGDLDYVGSLWVASDGNRSLDLNGNQAGAISQSFDTISGKEYEVQFDMAGNPDGLPAVKTLQVSAAGDSRNFTFDTTGYDRMNMGWEGKSFLFTATGSTTTLTFTSLTPDSPYGPALDNVVVRPPCPISSALGDTSERNATLETLYRFRDEVMAQSREGRRYIRRYYRHAWEASWLLLRHPELRMQTHSVLKQILPVLEAAGDGQQAVLTTEDMADIEDLLEVIAVQASPRLRWTIQQLQSDLHHGELLSVFGIDVAAAR